MGKKICANCNAQVDESVKFCIMCGKQEFIGMPQHAQPQLQTQPQPQFQSQPQGFAQPQFQYQGKPPKMDEVNTSPKFGITGFILSLIGLSGMLFISVFHMFFLIFLSLPSLGFSIPGLGKRRKCKWMAIAGIIFCVVSLAVFVLKIYYGNYFLEYFSGRQL